MNSPFKDKNGRILAKNDIVKISDALMQRTSCCRKEYAHVWLADWDDEPHWILSYNHHGSETSDRMADLKMEDLEWVCNDPNHDFDFDFEKES